MIKVIFQGFLARKGEQKCERSHFEGGVQRDVWNRQKSELHAGLLTRRCRGFANFLAQQSVTFRNISFSPFRKRPKGEGAFTIIEGLFAIVIFAVSGMKTKEGVEFAVVKSGVVASGGGGEDGLGLDHGGSGAFGGFGVVGGQVDQFSAGVWF